MNRMAYKQFIINRITILNFYNDAHKADSTVNTIKPKQPITYHFPVDNSVHSRLVDLMLMFSEVH